MAHRSAPSSIGPRRLLQLGLLASALCCAVSARADDFHGTRSEKLEERSHRARMTMAPGHAKLVVRRTVFNGGPRHDQAMFYLSLPPRSVAIGLRTLGFVDGRPHWFAGDLMEAEAAAAKYRELTGIGGYYPKDPALLSWRSQDLLALQVFPCPPAQHKSVEYTLVLPTDYHGGRHHLTLPRMGTAELAATLVARPAPGAGQLWRNGKTLSSGKPVSLGPNGFGDITLAPRWPAKLSGALAVVPFAKDRVLTRYRVEAASKLSHIPQHAALVIVLDGSRSLGQSRAQAQVAAARAYLSHWRFAHVEVITFDRKVHRRYGRFVSPAAARQDLASYDIERQNGSHVDRALTAAHRLLSQVPAEAPKRIVLFTDTRTRSSLSVAQLAATARAKKTIVHLVHLDNGAPALRRDDEHPWTPVARPSGGVFWQGSASVQADRAQDMGRVYEELARPVRIHHLRVSGSAASFGDPPFATTLNEGEGLVDYRIRAERLRWVEIEGELWAKPVRRRLRPDAAEGKLWSALVFGSSRLGELSEPEMMVLAEKGGAVSPVTSYLAIEPGVRPSTEGLDWGSGQGFGSGHGRLGRSHRARPVRVRMGAMIDPATFLREKLGEAKKRCGGAASNAEISLETTFAEVVDVPTIKLDPGANPALAPCLEEATWALDLPSVFALDWKLWTVSV